MLSAASVSHVEHVPQALSSFAVVLDAKREKEQDAAEDETDVDSQEGGHTGHSSSDDHDEEEDDELIVVGM